MRKLIIAATTVAALAVPAVSMAAQSTVVPSRTMTPYTAQYTDSYGPAADQFNIVGTHIVRVAKNPANSFVEDKFTVKITDPATGKPAPEFASSAGKTITWPAGWASDSTVDPGAPATSMIAHINAKGTGFTAIATYSLGS
jgi:hypothetical protein